MRTSVVAFVLLAGTLSRAAVPESPEGWSREAPREELLPEFSFSGEAGENRNEGGLVLQIAAGGRDAVDGAWVKTIPVEGGHHYRFTALRVTEGVTSPRRSAVAKITWQSDDGNLVRGEEDFARPEYPLDRGQTNTGETLVSDTYSVPIGATRARIELRLRWTGGSVQWRKVELVKVAAPPARIVRLAAVHARPEKGSTNDEKCRQFAPLIAEAAEQKADLVCLPESLTFYHSGRAMVDCAEPIPGPSTEYFGTLARKHDLYIVAGLTEREGSVVYNTAVLSGPDGKLVGKYRKACLPREEIEAGLTPGEEYPVFETRFGKVGMMICWDVQFPEVARNLAAGGAEVIAMPIWGGNPTLASARAIENQVYLVSSTYSDASNEAMVTGVWDHEGKLLARNGADWGKVVVTEVDLNRRHHWNWLGDFKARINRERPASGFVE